MERLLARLERKLGKYAIEHLTWVIVGGMAMVFVVSLSRPQFVQMLTLDLNAVRHGQVWRLITYLFVPRESRMVWVFFALYWLWLMGTNLENEWGAFKFNVYYLIGMLGTTAAAAITGRAAGNYFLNLSLTFAFATIYPDYQFLMIIIPMRMKWLGWLMGAYVAYAFAIGDWADRGAILASFANYFLFFGGHLWSLARGQSLQMKQAARRASMREDAPASSIGHRACAICGAKEEDGADIRVCSCEKCNRQARNLCLEHARNH